MRETRSRRCGSLVKSLTFYPAARTAPRRTSTGLARRFRGQHIDAGRAADRSMTRIEPADGAPRLRLGPPPWVGPDRAARLGSATAVTVLRGPRARDPRAPSQT